MRAQGQRAASGPVWADWFLELEEMLERYDLSSGHRSARFAGRLGRGGHLTGRTKRRGIR